MKPFATLSVALLGAIAALQLFRFLQGWPVLVNGVAVPLWVSGVAALILALLALALWRESRR